MGDVRPAPASTRPRPTETLHDTLRSMADGALVGALLDASRKEADDQAGLLTGELQQRLRFRGAALATITQGVVAIGSDARVTDSNAAAERLLGYAPPPGEPISFIAKTQPGCHAPDAALREGRVLRCDAILRRADGTLFPALVTCAPLFDDAGVTGAVLVFQDDLDRLRADEARARREAEESAHRLAILKDRYESLAKAASQAVFVADPDGRATQEVQGWTELTGQKPEEAMGYGWLDAYHPDDRERALAEWHDAQREGRPFVGEYRVRTRDGGYRMFSFRVVPVLEPDGRLREWVGACADVTERRAMEREILRSEERHRQMVEMMPDPIVVHQRGSIVYANPAALELMGARAPEELLGRSVLDFVHADSRATVVERMRRMATTREPLPLEDERVVRLDGRTLDVQVAAMPILYDGEPAAQLLLRDVTAERAAAEQMRRFSETLEARVRDRTAEMMALNRELEAFSYSVSHDLRAPLRGVSTFANILSEEHSQELSPEARDLVERIRRDADRMGRLIHDLLALSRTGRGELRRERFDLAALARSVWAGIERRDPARVVRFVAPAELWADADPGLVRVVLENLLGNAWKFTARKPDARVEVGVEERDGKPAYFVRDNGAGFDMAQAGRLFQPFERLHEGREFEGTGVGLATVARIVQRHGGRVRAEGERGKGATIWFTLGR